MNREKKLISFKSKAHVVKENQFLLINKAQQYFCEVKEKNIVHGFCLNLEEDLLQKIYHQISRSEESLIDNPDFFCKEQFDFHETVYSSSDIFNQFLIKTIRRTQAGKMT